MAGKDLPEVGEIAEAAGYIWSRASKIVDAFDRGVGDQLSAHSGYLIVAQFLNFAVLVSFGKQRQT
jgi:hypothetical protein